MTKSTAISVFPISLWVDNLIKNIYIMLWHVISVKRNKRWRSSQEN